MYCFVQNNVDILPSGPCLIKEGGYRGWYLENFLFSKPEQISSLIKNDDYLEDYWHALVSASNQIDILIDCPFCQERKVQYFASVKNSEKIPDYFISCGAENCLSELKLVSGNAEILPIRLSTLIVLEKFEGHALSSLLCRAWGINRYADENEIFKFFFKSDRSFGSAG